MRIGVIGAGVIGSTLANLWADTGHEVKLASRHPELLQNLVYSLGNKVSAGTPAEAAKFGELSTRCCSNFFNIVLIDWLNQFIPNLRQWQIDIHSHNLRGISRQKEHLEDSLLDYGDPVLTCKNLNLTLQTVAFSQASSDSTCPPAKPAQGRTSGASRRQ